MSGSLYESRYLVISQLAEREITLPRVGYPATFVTGLEWPYR